MSGERVDLAIIPIAPQDLPSLDEVPAPGADVSLAGHKLTNVGDAVNPTDALNMESGDARYGASDALAFGSAEFYGHSLTQGGSSDQATRGMDGRLAAMLHAEDINRTVGGAVLCWDENGTWGNGGGGWAHLYRNTEHDLFPGFSESTEEGYERAGDFEPKGDYSQVWFGINDLARLGPTNLTPLTNAAIACISRLRASNILEETDSSVTLTGSGWSTVTGPAEPAKSQSGSGWAKTTNVGDTVTVNVWSAYPGGIPVALAFLSGANGEGALWSFTVDGVAAGTLDTRNVNAKDYGTGANGRVTPAIMRFTGLSSGAHTIVATATAINVEGRFDCWWPESRVNRLVGVMLAERPYDYTEWGSSPYTPTDADIPTLNAALQAAAAVFDSDVMTIALDPVINKQQTYFASDNSHHNDEGQALVTATAYAAIKAHGRTAAQHAAGNMRAPGIARRPWNSWRNVIQAGQPGACPLTLYGRNAGDQSEALLLLGRSDTTGPDGGVYLPTSNAQYFSQTLAGDILVYNGRGGGNSIWLASGGSGSGTPGLQVNGFGVTSLLALVAKAGTASTPALTAQGAAGQTAPLQKWQNSSSSTLAFVDASGNVLSAGYVCGSYGSAAQGALGVNGVALDASVASSTATATGTGTGDKLALYASGSSGIGFGVQGGRLVAYMPATVGFAVRTASSSGNASSGSDAVLLTPSGTGVFTSTAPAVVTLALTSAAAQTADILQLQTSTGAALLNFTAAGKITQYEYAFSTWKTLPHLSVTAPVAGGVAAGTYIFYYGGSFSIGGTNSAFGVFYLDPADHAAGSRTVYIRIRGIAITNAVAPGVTFTISLIPVSTYGGASGTNPTVTALGTPVCSATITTPSATTATKAVSSATAFPSAGFYVLAFATSGSTAAGANSQLSAVLQVQQA